MDTAFKKADLELIKALFDKTDACIYLTEAGTKKVLYMNAKMKKDFNYKDAEGHICWEVMHSDQDGPCEDCPCKTLEMSGGEPVVRFVYNKRVHRYYKLVDSYVKLEGGLSAHLHHFFDITEFKEEQRSLKEQIHVQALLKDISLDLGLCVDYRRAMGRAIEKLGEFMHADSVYVWQYLEEIDAYEAAYIWKRKEGGGANAMPALVRCEEMPEAFRDMLRCPEHTITSEEVVELPEQMKRWVEAHDVRSFIAVPISPQMGHFGVLMTAGDSYDMMWEKAERDLVHTVGGIISACIDRERLTEQFTKAKRVLYDVIDNVPSYIYWKDDNGRYSGGNKLFASSVGIHFTEILGKTDEELAEICKNSAISAITDEVLRKFCGTQGDEAVTIEMGEGEDKRWYSCRRIDIINKKSERASVLGVISDVTDRVKMELEMAEKGQQLKEALEVAESNGRAKTDFLSRMSHEIRTPMNAIIGMAHIAASTDDIDKIKTCISKIESASDQLLCIINDILDMSKIESGKMDIVNDPFNLEKMLIETCDIIMVKADEKKQNLQFELGRDVPFKVIGDEFRLSQVITNLVANAVKFTPEHGDVNIKIKTIGTISDSVTLEFSVSDTGIGIPLEDRERLFGAFEQLSGGASRKYGGTGLGLTICKRIVELMDGEIWVESTEGEGSTFTFRVTMGVAERESKDLATLSVNYKNLRILFVDDNEEMRIYFKELMEQYQIYTDYSESGEKALEKIKDAYKKGEPYSIIFIDYRMPGINGVETAKRIAQEFGEAAIVILISITEWSEIREDALNAGIKRFLPKPLFPSQIVNAINEGLGAAPILTKKEKGEYPNLKGKKILIAEDIEVNCDIISAIIEPTMAEVEFAGNGEIAFEMIKESPDKYDLVLMDVYMPVMDGYEATDRIRKFASKTIPIVAMTANVFNEDIEKCIKSGMDGHIGKPIDEKALMKNLRHYLGSAEGGAAKSGPDESDQPDGYEGYLPYIDVEEALQRVRGNQKLFMTMLKSYRGGTVYDEMLRAIEAQDMNKAQYFAHTLKGVAGNLSLKKIFDIVKTLDEQLKGLVWQEETLCDLDQAIEKTNQAIDRLLNERKGGETQ